MIQIFFFLFHLKSISINFVKSRIYLRHIIINYKNEQ